ncbi:MAG: Ig-like domain-containing protein, partial [Gemmatimonadota bacterium]|nr:Ig-like domain-containing protein [Gemmatimonadota bacterium]
MGRAIFGETRNHEQKWRLHQVLIVCQTLLWLWLFVGFVTVDAQERPRVVRTSPENGAMSVDPATNELRVTFDQPMVTSGYSFVGGGPTFPEVVGRPQWISNTTIVLPIRLKPDHAYWLSINSDRYQNFRGTNGLPAVPYPISFRTAPSGTVDSLSQELNRESLKQLRSAIEDRYSHRDLRGVDWDARFAEFESRLIDAKTRAQFATLAGQLLEIARDIHIWLKVGDETFASFRRSISPNVDLDLIKKTVSGFRSVNDVVATGRFQDGPAYLMIGTWRREQAGDIEAAGTWIDGLSSDDTLILDVRFNSGGAEQLAREIAGRFVEHPVVYAQHRFRDPSMPSGFSEIMTRTLNPTPSVPGFRG